MPRNYGKQDFYLALNMIWGFAESSNIDSLASPHSIPGLGENVLWFIGISLNQSQSSWVVLSAGHNDSASTK